jgi:uncharacterized membrane protein
MDFNLSEWLNLIARWIHVFAGILWIGQTYFFTWLDGRFSELLVEKGKEDPEGRVWMVHSGGFYVVEKQKVPRRMPGTLHWFKWEATTTWLSGMFLLVVVYYFGGLMVNEHVSEGTAIIAGAGFMLIAWPVYNLLWRSPLGRDGRVGASVSYALIVLAAYGLSHVMDGRAVYIHMGGMFGTLMAVNVWEVILPAQRSLVAALNAGQPPDQALAQRAKTRSKHNTFMVVPVVFIMISNHFPTATYGTSESWIVLSVLVLVGWLAARVLRRA